MSRKTSTIMRSIRLQLKTGYMKKEPTEYLFMKRYPPIHRDGQPKYYQIEQRKIPYMDLLEKAAAHHPIYSERVYPAYWQDEPLGLTLAKKQYQYMQNGDSEKEALKKAEEYVESLEVKSLSNLRALHAELKKSGAQAPFMNDQSVMNDILQWQELLKHVPYRDLDLADQGEVDHMIQTKILKWNEGERERRMGNRAFVEMFDEFRDELFPNPRQHDKDKAKRISDAKSQYVKMLSGLQYDKLKVHFPFYLQDYVKWFAKAAEESDTSQWRVEDRRSFSQWIVDALAYEALLIPKLEDSMTIEEKTAARAEKRIEVQRYMDTLKFQYFPMTLPGNTMKFEVPTVDSLRALLFKNEIGYKSQNGKVYVKRFYRIPGLLFPENTLKAALVADIIQDPELHSKIVHEDEGEESLLTAMRENGLETTAAPQIMAQLREYAKASNLPMPSYKNSVDGSDSETDLAMALDGVVKSAQGNRRPLERAPVYKDAPDSDSETAETRANASTAAALDSAFASAFGDQGGSALDQDDDLATQLRKKREEALEGDDESVYSSSDEDEVVVDSDVSSGSDNDSEGEEDVEDDEDQDVRSLVQRAEDFDKRVDYELAFQAKESARMGREMKARHLWKMPRPNIPVIGLSKA